MNSPFDQLNLPPPTERVDLEARSREMIDEMRRRDFSARCPAEFKQAIDRSRLPNLSAWDAADQWTPGTHPGLWLWSAETGKAKTRMAWRKLGQGSVKLGLRYVFITGANLGDLCYEYWRDGEPTEFVRRFRNHSLVVIDDADKFPLADERLARAFRELWDHFYAARVSVLCTANEPISYVGRIVGDSCRRRIENVCQEIAF